MPYQKNAHYIYLGFPHNWGIQHIPLGGVGPQSDSIIKAIATKSEIDQLEPEEQVDHVIPCLNSNVLHSNDVVQKK